MRGMQISTALDFTQTGRQDGFLRLPHSTDDSAYGFIPIPIVCIQNGTGPTILLLAGNHGDEYEGQVALLKLLAEVKPEDVSGRIIVVPAANFPAAAAGRRVSPYDGGNLNRCFIEGDAVTLSEQIAAYIEQILMPLCDYAVDLHSGGASLRYTPAGVGNIVVDDAARNTRMREVLSVFGAPVSFMSDTRLASRASFAAAAIRQNVVAIGTEAGGGASLSVAALQMVETGVRRLLAHLSIWGQATAVSGTRLLEVGGPDFFIYAGAAGIFEPYVEPGEMVVAGQAAGAIHVIEYPAQPPWVARFERSGMVLCRRVQGRTGRGDCLFHLGVDCD